MSITKIQSTARKFLDGKPQYEEVEFRDGKIKFVFNNMLESKCDNKYVMTYFFVKKDCFTDFNPIQGDSYSDTKAFSNIYDMVSASLIYGGFNEIKEPKHVKNKDTNKYWVFECESKI